MKTFVEYIFEHKISSKLTPIKQTNSKWGSGQNSTGNNNPKNRGTNYYSLQYCTDKQEVEEILDYFGIKNYKVEWNTKTKDGGKILGVHKDEKTGMNIDYNGWVVNVDGDVNLSNQGLKTIPFIFGTVLGTFDISHNKGLRSLVGSPEVCYNYFCNDCDLYDLVGCPVAFYGKQGNRIGSSLDGIKKGIFDCRNNKLKKLENLPETIGNLLCSGNSKEFTVLDLPDGQKDGQQGFIIRFEGVLLSELMKQYGMSKKAGTVTSNKLKKKEKNYSIDRFSDEYDDLIDDSDFYR